jgi:sigma-B regulation protein RsbU (phosphoserine phosphatase)
MLGSGKKPGPALGLFEDSVYATGTAEFEVGDTVMLFTDGLYEVEGKESQFYSEEMLVEAVTRRMEMAPGPLFDSLLAEIGQFSLHARFADDVCLVGMEFRR